MPPTLSPVKSRSAFLTFPMGIAVAVLFIRFPSWFWQPSTLHGIWLFEVLIFALVGLLGCMIAPRIPFISAVAGVLGVFTGVVADLIVHPTIEGGFARNLFPLEIAFHTIAATVGFGVLALAWKLGVSLTRRRIDV